MNLAAYVRVSTPRQLKEKTHLTQENEIKKWCQNNNHTVVRWYRDLAISGEEVHNRPEFMKMREDIVKKAEIEGIIAFKMSRVSRTAQDLLNFVNFVTVDAQKQVFLVKESVDTSTAMGRFFLSLLAAFIQFERETIIEVTEAGRLRAVEDGKKVGGPHSYEIKKSFVIKHLNMGLSPERIGSLIKVETEDKKTGKKKMVSPSGATIRRRMEEWGIYDDYKLRKEIK